MNEDSNKLNQINETSDTGSPLCCDDCALMGLYQPASRPKGFDHRLYDDQLQCR